MSNRVTVSTKPTKAEKYKGSHVSHEEKLANKNVMFYSRNSHLVLQKQDEDGNVKDIFFKDSMYETAKEDEIKFIRSLPFFDKDHNGRGCIFESSFPSEYVKDVEKQNQWLTNNPMLYETPLYEDM
jgi:hypothetical protein